MAQRPRLRWISAGDTEIYLIVTPRSTALNGHHHGIHGSRDTRTIATDFVGSDHRPRLQFVSSHTVLVRLRAPEAPKSLSGIRYQFELRLKCHKAHEPTPRQAPELCLRANSGLLGATGSARSIALQGPSADPPILSLAIHLARKDW